MKTVKMAIVALATALVASVGLAGSPTAALLKTRSKASAAVVPGKWHAGFQKCKTYAEKNKVPLIAVWSNGDACGHCVIFETAVNRTKFKNWMAESGCVFYFIYPGDKGDGEVGSKVFHWCRKNKNTDYPFVRIYWPAGKVDIATVGDTVDGVDSTTKGTDKAINYFKKKLAKFKPGPVAPAYQGGSFDFPDSEQARLEVEAGVTTNISFSLTRATTLAVNAATNLVLATYPNGSVVTNMVVWESGDVEKSVTLDTSSLTTANEQVVLTLLDQTGEEKGTSHIAVVKTENSPKNPAFVGEKSVHELGWGEWTMDLDVATNKVAKHNSGMGPTSARPGGMSLQSDPVKAHTLVMVGGCLWCPDCSAAELNFFGHENFKNWAVAKKVALVAIDIPNLPDTNASPCLLSKVVYKTSDRYITCNYTPGVSNEAMRTQSGIGYLTRHMISDEQAAEVMARNVMLAGKNTLNGGWNWPERANQNRIGVPSLLVLREDGTIAGRFTRYSDVGPKDWQQGVLKRLEELFAEADKSAAERAKDQEETNDSYTTTAETIGKREKVENHTVSFTDAQDVFKLDPTTTAGKRMKFSLTSANAVKMEIKVLNAAGTVQASTSGIANGEGITVDCDILSTNWYVQVGSAKTEGYPDDAFFAHTSDSSTVCGYTLETDFVAIPTEVADTVTLDDLSGGLTMALVSNELYRIEGIAADANPGVLQAADGSGKLFTALVTDSVKLNINSTTVKYQLWHPGKVGFSTASAVAVEPEGDPAKKPFVEYKIRLVRKDGVSGTATATVTMDQIKSALLDELIELPAGFSDALTWNEGEADDKFLAIKILNNPYADGDQTVYFDLESGGDATNGINRLRLTLRDNDPKRPGKIAIVSSDPAIASDRTAYARAGSEMTIDLGRVDGSDGDAKVSMTASLGTLDNQAFEWPRRIATNQTAKLTLPDTKGKTVSVEVTPAKGTAVDSDRRKLSVVLLDANVPGFKESAVEIHATRYIPIAPREIELDEKANASANVKLVSGTLAAGLSWKLADGKLQISGVPTKAGATTAKFRVFNGKVGGLVTEVTVDVLDPVVSGGGDGSSPLNASVAKARTFADVPVVDANTNLVGILTLTLPRDGRASAKYRMAEGTVTLSCQSWCGLDEMDGRLLAALVGNFKGREFALAVDALADGSVAVGLTDPLHGIVECLTDGNEWSKTNTATDFKGYYTVSLPIKAVDSGVSLALGAGYVTLKMNTAAAVNAGKFSYAGVYPNGKPFSGSVVLTATDWDGEKSYWKRGVLPLIVSGDSDALAGALRITPGASDSTAADVSADGSLCQGRCSYAIIRRSVHPLDGMGLSWSHVEKATNVSCKVALDAFGTYYVSTENFANCCKSTLSTDKLSFFSVGGEALAPELEDDLVLGALKNGGALSVAASTIYVTHTPKTKKKAASNAIKFVPAKNKKKKVINPNGLSLAFTLSSGLVSGAFQLPLEDGGSVAVTYKGVVMPGWGSEECTDCGMGGSEAELRPFISGTAWFNDTLEYDDAEGRDRTVTVRRSVPFSIGVDSGK